MDYIKIYKDIENLLSKKALKANIHDLSKYYNPEGINQSFYLRLASSLQNGTSSGMDRSIKFNGENREEILRVLHGCDYKAVLKEYKSDKDLYNALCENITDGGKEAREKRASKAKTEEKKEKINKRPTNWEKYAEGLYHGAQFLGEENGNELIETMISYNGTDTLPMDTIKSMFNKIKEIKGLGPALICDWLKECGCTWLCKPDVHIKRVYQAMLETETNTTVDYEKIKDFDVIEYYFNWVQKLRKSGIDTTVYKLDKMIWLICTGEFYLHKDESTGRNTLIERIKAD